jgi:hypothetical protein
MAQPLIRGIQAVGNVDIFYEYNSGVLNVPPKWGETNGDAVPIRTDAQPGGVRVAGIRLDSEFMRAAQQIASSYVIPLLGGGGLALTNNNRTGTLSINCTRSSSPDAETDMRMTGRNNVNSTFGAGISSANNDPYYDMSLLAQYQQGQAGGDSWGATITIVFDFNGMGIRLQFLGCTVASVAPLVLTGNDAANYTVEYNYLDWVCGFSSTPQAST